MKVTKEELRSDVTYKITLELTEQEFSDFKLVCGSHSVTDCEKLVLDRGREVYKLLERIYKDI